MTLDELSEHTVSLFNDEEAGDYTVMVSTYSCGQTSRRELLLSELTVDHENRQIVILAEDN